MFLFFILKELLQHVASISSDDRVLFSNPKVKITLSNNQALAKTHGWAIFVIFKCLIDNQLFKAL